MKQRSWVVQGFTDDIGMRKVLHLILVATCLSLAGCRSLQMTFKQVAYPLYPKDDDELTVYPSAPPGEYRIFSPPTRKHGRYDEEEEYERFRELLFSKEPFSRE